MRRAASSPSSRGQRSWYLSPEGTATAQAGSRKDQQGQQEGHLASVSNAADGAAGEATHPATGEFARAAKWYAQLSGTVEQVTSELKQEFHAEAQRTLQVLAAAVDLFKDAATSTPGVEREFERLCQPVQRQIWPEDFGGAAATVAADLAALRQRAKAADEAAAQVVSLAVKTRRL